MNARTLADDGYLVAFGIKPDGVETGYGYLKKGKREQQGFQIDQFVEKPSYQKAKEYVNSKEYFWNNVKYNNLRLLLLVMTLWHCMKNMPSHFT